jgi:hypothetical protein
VRPIGAFVVLCLLYGLGLLVDLYASDLSPSAKLALLVGGILGSAFVYYWQFYQPTVRIEQKYVSVVLDHLFRALVDTYRQQHPGDYDLRANVMRMRRKHVVGPRFLRIDVALGEYTPAEHEQAYRVGVGCAGNAVARNQQTFYDAIQAHEHRSGLTATQREVTAHVNSILSTPVYRPSDVDKRSPIAVLNLDSGDFVGTTGFREAHLQDLAVYYAEVVGAILQ